MTTFIQTAIKLCIETAQEFGDPISEPQISVCISWLKVFISKISKYEKSLVLK